METLQTLAERIAKKAVVLEEGEEGTVNEGFIYVRCFECYAGTFWREDRHKARPHLDKIRTRVTALITAELEPAREALNDLLAVVDITDGTYAEFEQAEKALVLLGGVK